MLCKMWKQYLLPKKWYEVIPEDWIITGIQGEKYPCKNDIFLATYDEVDDTSI